MSLSAIAHLVRMRRMSFLGLTQTGLNDHDGDLLASALSDSMSLAPADESTLELLQMEFSQPVRAKLLEAAERTGVFVLMSDVRGPALRGRP